MLVMLESTIWKVSSYGLLCKKGNKGPRNYEGEGKDDVMVIVG